MMFINRILCFDILFALTEFNNNNLKWKKVCYSNILIYIKINLLDKLFASSLLTYKQFLLLILLKRNI